MTQRRTVSGRRSVLTWLAIVLVLVLAVALAAIVFIIGPQQQLRQQAQATAEAQQAEVERLYAAGVAFQNARDCAKAADSLAQVISMEPDYKDARSRLTEARTCQQATEATAAAQAIAIARAAAEANATATADARTLAQAVAATATADAAAAIETAYRRGLGYFNLERWADAKAAFEEVFAADPTYKDVQALLPEIEAKLAEVQKLAPTVVPGSTSTPRPTPQTEGPPWWDAGYRSRQQLTIGNNADTLLPAGYSVKMDLTGEKATDFFRQSASTQPGDDVRIVYWNGSQWEEVDRYVEAFTSTEVRMWFAINDEIPPNGVSRDYWAYFNNVEATDPPSDALKVFMWWDDFHLNTVSKYIVLRVELTSMGQYEGGWRGGAMSYDPVNERVSITTGDNIWVLVQPPVSGKNIVIEGDLYFTRTFPYSGVYTGFVRVVDTSNHYVVSFPVSVYDAVISKVEGGKGIEVANAGKLAYPLDTWHHITMGAYEDRIEAWMDGTQVTTTDAAFREGGVGIGMSQAGGYIDNIRVRKYVSPEPSVFLAPEVESR